MPLHRHQQEGHSARDEHEKRMVDDRASEASDAAAAAAEKYAGAGHARPLGAAHFLGDEEGEDCPGPCKCGRLFLECRGRSAPKGLAEVLFNGFF